MENGTIKGNYLLFYNGVFSNFYPCEFTIDGIEFNCSEQYFMYKKALYFDDKIIADSILQQRFPSSQKSLGRKVKNFDPDIWMVVCEQVMFEACFAKFSQNQDLKEIMLKYQGFNFVEASPYDKIWGIELDEKDPKAEFPKFWRGLNLLGKVLDNVLLELSNG